MEQKEERTLPSTSSLGGEGAAAAGSPTTTTTTIPGEAAVAVNNEATKVYTTEELEALSRSVFMNKLVSGPFH